jgi:hypothetical protein
VGRKFGKNLKKGITPLLSAYEEGVKVYAGLF